MKPLLMPDPPYQALIFDCDGTLANTTPMHYQAWAEAITTFGGTLPQSWYYQHAGTSTLELVGLINQAFGYQLDPQTVKRVKHDRFAALLVDVQPVPETLEVINYHRGKIPLAIASGGSRQNVEATLGTLGLSDVFQVIVTIEDVSKGKPDPEIFLTTAQRLDIPPAACVVYEDTDVGILAAQQAGMMAIDIRQKLHRTS
jgi:beta-phosphoglucomutase-like phosphatase (HAD superfamily)